MSKRFTKGSKQIVFYDPKRASRRKCGPCSACCTAPSLRARGAKEFDQICPHRATGKKNGCAIYNERPEDCQVYTCFWREGFLKTIHRPDKLGVILDTGDASLYKIQHEAGLKQPPMLAREAWDGAFAKKEFKKLRDLIASQYVIILVQTKASGKKSATYGPTEEIRDKVIAAIRNLPEDV